MAQLTWERYAAAWARLHGGFDVHRAAPLVRGWLRLGYALGAGLGRLGVSPSAVTTAGLVVCLPVPVLASAGGGWPLAAAVLVLVTAVADTVDGAVAVVTERATRLGSVYDSVVDRLTEACWAAAFWQLGAPGPVLAGALGGCWLHEYVRARATAVGMSELGTVTVGERPTRVLVSVFGLVLCGAAGAVSADLAAGVATVVAAVWLVLGLFGLGQLIGAVRAALG